MSRGLKIAIVLAGFSALAFAGPESSVIRGQVKNTGGIPQMGAVVQLFASSSSRVVTVFTDERGFYAATVLPGLYHLKVSAPSYLPLLRENVSILAGARMVVDLTLSTLGEALQLGPAKAARQVDTDDWKWTLRSAANRPILRLRDDPEASGSRAGNPGDSGNFPSGSAGNSDDKVLRARLSFVAGNDASGAAAGDLRTAFNVEEALSPSSRIAFNGNVSYGAGDPNAAVQAVFYRELVDGSRPRVALAVHRYASLDSSASSVAMSLDDEVNIAGFAELRYGMEAREVQFRGSSMAVQPFLSIDAPLDRHSTLAYRVATSRPQPLLSEDSDEREPQGPADLPPGLSMRAGRPYLERAWHHELAYAFRQGASSLQVAGFSDRLHDTALAGVAHSGVLGAWLANLDSGSFAYDAGELRGAGFRLEYERELSRALRLAVDYAYGPTLRMQSTSLEPITDRAFHCAHAHSFAGKISGKMPASKTRLVAAYKWTGDGALLPVDLFNPTSAQADPYLTLSLRQPIPAKLFLPKGMEALVDVRNLLAQGYRPVLSNDGHTMYLVEAPRSVRGGLAFTF